MHHMRSHVRGASRSEAQVAAQIERDRLNAQATRTYPVRGSAYDPYVPPGTVLVLRPIRVPRV